MPRVSLFNGGQSVQTNAPGAVDINPGGNQSLRVSTRGAEQAFMAGTDAMNRALQGPRIPLSLADNSGDLAVSRAIGEAGEVFGYIAEKEAHVREVGALADAELAMAEARDSYLLERQNDLDFDGYHPKWEKVVEGVRAKVLGDGVPRRARQEIERGLALWALRGSAEARSASQRGVFGETKKNILLNMDRETANMNPDGVAKWANMAAQTGVMSDADVETEIFERGQQIRSGKIKVLQNQLGAAASAGDDAAMTELVKSADFLRGDESALLMAEAKEKGSAVRRDRMVKEIAEEGADDPRGVLERLKERKDGAWTSYPDLDPDDRDRLAAKMQSAVNAKKAETMESLAKLAVSDEPLNETALKSAMLNDDITADFYAKLKRVSDERRPDAPSDKAGALITLAGAYDPTTDDAARTEYFRLFDMAVESGLSKRQLQLFQGTLADAAERNVDESGRAESAVIKWARETIADRAKMFSEDKRVISVLDADLQGALKDEDKLKKFGIDSGAAGKIAEKNGAEAFLAFRRAAIAAVPLEQAKKNGMTDWEYNLFARAARASEAATIEEVNPLTKQNAEFNAAVLHDELAAWVSQFKATNKRAPDSTETRDWLIQALKPANDARTWSGLFKKRATPAITPEKAPATPPVSGARTSVDGNTAPLPEGGTQSDNPLLPPINE